jgi:hypothetical protein
MIEANGELQDARPIDPHFGILRKPTRFLALIHRKGLMLESKDQILGESSANEKLTMYSDEFRFAHSPSFGGIPTL